MARIERFEDMQVWRLTRAMVRDIYAATSRGGFARDFALRDQMRRAAVSVLSNIAEGFERGGNREFIHFLYIAKGSAGELRAQMYVVQDQGYMSGAERDVIGRQLEQVSKQLRGLIDYLRGSDLKGERFHVSEEAENYVTTEGCVS